MYIFASSFLLFFSEIKERSGSYPNFVHQHIILSNDVGCINMENTASLCYRIHNPHSFQVEAGRIDSSSYKIALYNVPKKISWCTTESRCFLNERFCIFIVGDVLDLIQSWALIILTYTKLHLPVRFQCGAVQFYSLGICFFIWFLKLVHDNSVCGGFLFRSD